MITGIACFTYAVADMVRARAFYEGVLGLQPSPDLRGEWLEYDLGAATFAITTIDIGRPPGAKGGLVAFEVDDLDQTVAALRAAGVPFVFDICESPICRLAMVTDPDGNEIVIHKCKAASCSTN